MTGMPSAITVTGLRKSFGDHVVLDGIDLDVAEGNGLRATWARTAPARASTATSRTPCV